MTRDDFDHARTEIERETIGIRKARFDEAAFGSWFIETSRPRRRLVWDGRGGTLIVQAKSLLGWKDQWWAPKEEPSIRLAVTQLR